VLCTQFDNCAALEYFGGIFCADDYRQVETHAGYGAMSVGIIAFQDQAAGLSYQGKQLIIGLRNNEDIAICKGFQRIIGIFADAQLGAALLLSNALTGNQNMAHHMHFHEVGGATDTKGHTGSHHNKLAIVKEPSLFAGFHCAFKKLVGAVHFIDHERDNAPAEAKLVKNGSVRSAADDGAVGPEFGDHLGGFAGFGHGDNGRGAKILRRGTGGMGNGVGDIGALFGSALLKPLT